MIFVNINGGIGNQLFQYAFAKHVSIIKNDSINLDIRWYKKSKDRFFRLNYFNIDAKVGLTTKDSIYHSFHDLSFFSRQVRKVLPKFLFNNKYYIAQQQFHFYDYFINEINTPQNIYLGGLWQSELFFGSTAAAVKKDLQFKNELFSEIMLSKANEIINENSIMLHIRRGDYLKLPIYEILGVDYFIRAIELILARVSEPKFYIFSDDMIWVKANLSNYFKQKNITAYIVNDTKIDIEDFFLMSKCKHAIISNSTFSWWAAWLNENSDKLIIGPDKWFKPEITEYLGIDIIPDRWIKL